VPDRDETPVLEPAPGALPVALSLSSAPPSPGPPRARRRLLAWLAAAALLGSLATVPYAAHLLAGLAAAPGGPSLPPGAVGLAAVASALFTAALAFLLGWLGVVLGERIGLGDPVLAAWAASRGVDRDPLRRVAVRAVPAGLAGGALAALIVSRIPTPLRAGITEPNAWEGFLGSLGAGVTEEMLCRLGLLTLFAWLGARLLRQARPGALVLWIANLLAGLLFAALHLPQANALLLHMDAAALAVVLAGNLAIGLICGWLYWRLGILAAMIAHGSADLVLHVLPPLLLR